MITKTQKTIFISSFYIFGLIAYFCSFISPAAIIMFILCTVLYFTKTISARFSIILYLIFIAALINCHFQLKTHDNLSLIAPEFGIITGRITSIPTTNNPEKTKFYIEAEQFEYDGIIEDNLKSKTIATVFDERENLAALEIGDVIKITGKLSKPREASNPSQFDYAKYLRNFDTFTLFFASGKTLKTEKKADTFYWKSLQKINKTRNHIISKHSQNLKSPNIELLGGIVFGDDAVNPPDNVRKSFINSGLLHILAASGMNVTLIFGIWFFITSKFKVHYKLSTLTGIFLIIFYTAMTGFGPSIMRASLMLILILIGKLIDKDADTLALLFFVALLLLLYDPAMINHIGFQLSFAVTFGLLLTCPILFNRIDNKFINFIASSCLVPVIAQIYAAPIQMFYFNTFAAYSVLANIAIIPFLTFVSFVGFISSIIALIPKISFFICKFADFILNPFLTALVNISDFFSNLPHSLIYTSHPSIIQIILFYSGVLVITLYFKFTRKNKSFLISAVIISLLFLISLIKLPNNNCEILFFDMGNADSILIKSPENKYILIDTGKQPYKKAMSNAEQIILKYFKDKGIKHLHALIITHFDADHCGGSIPVLKNIKVDNVYITDTFEGTKTSDELIRYFNNQNIKTITPKNNSILINEKDFKIKSYKADSKRVDGDNENSLITFVQYKNHKILLMGDAGFSAYESLKQKEFSGISLLKIGHHGGKGCLNTKMGDELSPKITIITTGENNYGHPHNKTFEMLRNVDSKIIRTDYNHAVKTIVNNKGLTIYTYQPAIKRFQKYYKLKQY